MENLININYVGCHNSKKVNHKLTWHSHNCPELVMVVKGNNRTFFENGKTFYCQAGSLLITPANLPHRQIDEPECTLYYIGFDYENTNIELNLRQLIISPNDYIAHWLKQIYQMWIEEENSIESQLLLQAIIHRAMRMDKENNIANNHHVAIGKAIKFINNAVEKNEIINLSDIANAGNVSVSHLNALLKKEFDTSAMQLLTKKRMNKARTLLANPLLSISEIAELCAYDDVNYFIRIFKRHHYVTPSNFRKDLRHNQIAYQWKHTEKQ